MQNIQLTAKNLCTRCAYIRGEGEEGAGQGEGEGEGGAGQGEGEGEEGAEQGEG
jgi:hypothetical protein